MIQTLGSTRVILTLSPDPPRSGEVNALVQLVGASTQQMRKTTLKYSTSMPAMNMNGPTGLARNTGTAFTFDAQLGMATDWVIVLQFSGATVGTVIYRFGVSSQGGSNAMSTMAMGDNAGPWRTAFFALIVLIVIGYFVLRRERRAGAIVAGAAVVLVILGLAILQSRFAAPAMDMSAMENVAGGAPGAVRTIRLSRAATITQTVSAPGTVAPFLMQDVVARVGGSLESFDIYTGDHVRAGEQIAALYAPELGSAAAAAQAAAQAAEIQAMHHAPNEAIMARNDVAAKNRQADYWTAEIARERLLLREGAVSQQEYQDELAQATAAKVAARNAELGASDAVASVEQAQSRYTQATQDARSQSTLASYRAITAADDGVVVKRLVDPGTYVQAGTPIARIAVLDRVRIQANVAQDDLSRIHLGVPLEASTANGGVVRGRVTSVQPVADPQTHTGVVEAIMENLGEKLQPGAFVNVTIRMRNAAPSGSISLPAVAVTGGSTSPRVWLNRSGFAQSVAVHVVSNDGTTAIVNGPIPPGSSIVTDGAALLSEGQQITETSP
ncbi:MAG TPA: efflux RND transporter periplasmic adaptor subunit [Candidatus Baltobacteraceae bacterium]|nr:efflux RND transporter periplasmic adaptor subunit [Candidatus Baltobacteraceae bacterium]